MRRKIRRWKTYAKETLHGNYSIIILALLAITAVNMVVSELVSALFGGTTILNIITGQAALFIVSVIMGVFSAGLSYMLLNMARGKAYTFGDLLYFFKNYPDRVIIAGIVLGIIDLIVSIPYYYVNYFVDPGTTLEENMQWLMKLGLMLLLASVLNLLLTLPFVLTYFLLADDLELGGIEALKMSAKLMKGNIGKYLLLEISFIPLLILSVFTLYIALLWLVPYMEMSVVMFYRDLRGEFTPEMPGYDTPYSLAREAEKRRENDDYNAEA